MIRRATLNTLGALAILGLIIGILALGSGICAFWGVECR